MSVKPKAGSVGVQHRWKHLARPTEGKRQKTQIPSVGMKKGALILAPQILQG